jgi:hypothetical protein
MAMGNKKLTPHLPKDEAEIAEKGFLGNISTNKKFITDGHSMFMASDVTPGMIFKKKDPYIWRPGKPPDEASMQRVWDAAEVREGVGAHFIGCAKLRGFLVAVIRDEQTRFFAADPYILALCLTAVKADSLSVSAGLHYEREPLALLREGRIVALVMSMRFSETDLSGYDLSVPAVPLYSPNGGQQ